MAHYTYTIMAQAYGSGDYNSCDYNCATTSTAAGSNNGNGASPLADTGVAVVGVITLACLIVFAALIVRFIGRRKRQDTHSHETQQSSADHDQRS
jgi:hypothetical protein